MTIRVAAIEVSHWHALHDAAYLRHLVAMPDVELVAIQDSDAGLVARRAPEVGSPPTFTDYRQMLATTRPDFVVALGRHRQMAGIAHDLLDQGYPFVMEKPMGINAAEVEAVAAKAARLDAFVAVPLAQRYTRPRAARCGALWPAVAHLRPAQPAWTGALPNLGLRLDARSRRGRRRLPPQSGAARVRHVPSPDRRGGGGDWRPTEPPRA
jgi:Oxidoreductase family, NAD-binding Rossmann fold